MYRRYFTMDKVNRNLFSCWTPKNSACIKHSSSHSERQNPLHHSRHRRWGLPDYVGVSLRKKAALQRNTWACWWTTCWACTSRAVFQQRRPATYWAVLAGVLPLGPRKLFFHSLWALVRSHLECFVLFWALQCKRVIRSGQQHIGCEKRGWENWVCSALKGKGSEVTVLLPVSG